MPGKGCMYPRSASQSHRRCCIDSFSSLSKHILQRSFPRQHIATSTLSIFIISPDILVVSKIITLSLYLIFLFPTRSNMCDLFRHSNTNIFASLIPQLFSQSPVKLFSGITENGLEQWFKYPLVSHRPCRTQHRPRA